MGELAGVRERCGQWAQRSGVGDALMGPVLVVEALELPQGVQQMPLVPDQRAVQQLPPAGLHPPFHDRVHAGIRAPLSTTLMPRSASTASNMGGNLPSRSRMRYFAREPASSRSMTRLRAAWVTHVAVG